MTRRFEVPEHKIPALGERVFLDVGGKFLILFNIEGQFYAIEDSCPHQGASLFSGKLEGCMIQCSAHGLRFNLKDGCMLKSDMLKLKTYPIEINETNIVIMLEDGVGT